MKDVALIVSQQRHDLGHVVPAVLKMLPMIAALTGAVDIQCDGVPSLGTVLHPDAPTGKRILVPAANYTVTSGEG